MAAAERLRSFRVVLIKPSHYDADGYVIQWYRSAIPSNTLAALFGLVSDCARRELLGGDIRIEITAYDETNSRVQADGIAALIEAASDGGLVMLAGVQSNQFPRALDIARPLRERGIAVAIGGFHVSGTIAMLPELDPDVAAAQALGISLFAGELEGRMDEVLLDAFHGRLKPLYNFMKDLPAIDGMPTPILPASRVLRTTAGLASFDAGRGCPFECSFCTIINVQGRRSRRRTPDDVERILRENLAQGIGSFFITDDNFARNKDWEAIFDRIIAFREREQVKCSFVIQVDTLCHRIPNFIEKAARAGVRRVFIGLESINPDNLLGAKKRQNRITEYRDMLLAWKNARVITCAGYIIGFPHDTCESVRRDIDVIQRELPIDLLEFFVLTPLPGSEDHKRLYQKGVWMDPDMNRYDATQVTTAHPKMSKAEWESAYRQAWSDYYSDSHIRTVMRRASALGNSLGKTMFLMLWFKGCHEIENVHPLEGGILRMKFRRDRRPGRPLEPALTFYPRYVLGTLWKAARWAALCARYGVASRFMKRDRRLANYCDEALAPVTVGEVESLDLYGSTAAKGYIETRRRIDGLRTAGVPAPVMAQPLP